MILYCAANDDSACPLIERNSPTHCAIEIRLKKEEELVWIRNDSDQIMN